MTVVRDGLGTNLKLGARNVSICYIITELVKFQEKLYFNYTYARRNGEPYRFHSLIFFSCAKPPASKLIKFH